MAPLDPSHEVWDPGVVFLHDRNLGLQLLVLGRRHVPLETTKAFLVHPSSNESVLNNEVLWGEHTLGLTQQATLSYAAAAPHS